MITKDQWNSQILTGEHKVIFGITYKKSLKDYPKVVSRVSTPAGNHSMFPGNYDKYAQVDTWRYVPLVKTIYWWFFPEDNKYDEDVTIREVTVEHLKTKYKETVLYNKTITWGDGDPLNPGTKKSLMATAGLQITHNNTDYPEDVDDGKGGLVRKWPKMPTFKQWLKYHHGGD